VSPSAPDPLGIADLTRELRALVAAGERLDEVNKNLAELREGIEGVKSDTSELPGMHETMQATAKYSEKMRGQLSEMVEQMSALGELQSSMEQLSGQMDRLIENVERLSESTERLSRHTEQLEETTGTLVEGTAPLRALSERFDSLKPAEE
jgi:methyl-accepting chemotaxis protein